MAPWVIGLGWWGKQSPRAKWTGIPPAAIEDADGTGKTVCEMMQLHAQMRGGLPRSCTSNTGGEAPVTGKALRGRRRSFCWLG